MLDDCSKCLMYSGKQTDGTPVNEEILGIKDVGLQHIHSDLGL